MKCSATECSWFSSFFERDRRVFGQKKACHNHYNIVMIEFPWVEKTAAEPSKPQSFLGSWRIVEARGFVQWAAAVVEEVRGRVRNGSASSFLPYRGRNSSQTGTNDPGYRGLFW